MTWRVIKVTDQGIYERFYNRPKDYTWDAIDPAEGLTARHFFKSKEEAERWVVDYEMGREVEPPAIRMREVSADYAEWAEEELK